MYLCSVFNLFEYEDQMKRKEFYQAVRGDNQKIFISLSVLKFLDTTDSVNL